MRLCFLGPASSIHTQRWLTAFVERGHDVHLVDIPGQEVTLDDVTVHILPGGPSKVRFLYWVSALRGILAELRPDVLHGHYLTRYGWLAAASGFRPLVLTAWGSDTYVDPQRSRLGGWITSWALGRADLVTADAMDLQTRLITLGADPLRTHVIQWGVDTKVFQPGLATEELRSRLRLGNAPVILSTRGLTPMYNQDVMVEALPLIRQAVPGSVLVIKYNACAPDYLARVQQTVARLGLTEAVRFVDAAPHRELAAYYCLADVFISIASSDSTPVSLLEAMACGLTPVVSDLPALREWVTDGANGFCVPARDPTVLAAAVIRTLTDQALRGIIAETNVGLIAEKADHSSQMTTMEALYTRLALNFRRSRHPSS